MAILTKEDFTFYKHAIRRDPVALAEMKALAPDKQSWMNAMQGLEDWFESNRLNAKAAMETASGLTLPNALAKKLGKIWMERKWRGE